MFCEHCGAEIQPGEKFCATCGTPVKLQTEQPQEEAKAAEAQPEAAAQPQEEAKAAEAQPEAAAQPQEEAKAAEAQPEAAAQQSAGNPQPEASQAPVPPQSVPESPAGGEGKKPGKKKTKLVLGIVAAVVAVLAIGIVANASRVNNWAHRTFSSEEKYAEWVEEKVVTELSQNLAEIYSTFLLDKWKTADSMKVDTEISVSLTGDGSKAIDRAVRGFGVDMDWLESASVSASYGWKGSDISVSGGLTVNKQELLSAEAILMTQDETAYVSIPTLNGKYMEFDLDDFFSSSDLETVEEFEEVMNSLKDLAKSLPSQKDAEKLIARYLKVIIGQVNGNVKKESKTLKAGDVEAKVTELRIKLDGDTMAKVCEALAETMDGDSELLKLLEAVTEFGNEYHIFGASSYDYDTWEYRYIEYDADDLLDEIIENLEDMADYFDRNGSGSVAVRLYVDGKGNICGMKMSAGNDTFSMLVPRSGGDLGVEISYDDGHDSWSFTGAGKISGGQISGDFVLEVEDVDILAVTTEKFDWDAFKKGELKGKFRLALADKLSRNLDKFSSYLSRHYGTYISVMEDYHLDLDVNATNSKVSIAITLSDDKKEYGTASISAKQTSGSSISAPSSGKTVSIADEDDLEDWFDGIDWSKLQKTIGKIGLPSDLQDAVDDVIEEIEDDGFEALEWLIPGGYGATATSYSYDVWDY